MAYITQTTGASPAGDLTNSCGNAILVQLVPDGSGGVSGTFLPEQVLDAEALVDSILGPGFAVPLTGTIPRIIKRCAVDICLFYLYERKPEFYRADGKNPMFERYREAKQLLTDIRNGKHDMGNETSAKSASTGGAIRYNATPFIVDFDESTDGGTGGY